LLFLSSSWQGICDGPNSTKCQWTLYFDDENSAVGFWPPTLFGKLSEFANQADWGGEVYSPLDQPSPPMGTGKRPLQRDWDTIDLAHSRRIACAYENEKFNFLSPVDTELYKSDQEAYDIIDVGYQGEYWGRMILYDGPGGIKGA
jgi:hypothetical protein